MTEILILNHYASPGSGRHFQLGRELVRRGYGITIMASSYGHKSSEQRTENIALEGVNFNFVPTSPYRGNGFSRIRNMLQYAFRVRRFLPANYRPDIVIGSSVHPFAWLAAERIARKYEASYIAEVRDFWPQTLIDMGAISENGPTASFFRLLEKRAYRNSQRIIATMSEASSYICIRYDIEPEKIFHINNGVDLNEFDVLASRLREEAREILAPFRGKYLVAYAGAMGRANQLDTIIEAASILERRGIKDIAFLFFGQGPEENRIKSMAAQIAPESTYFMGHKPYSMIPAILVCCDAHVVAMQDITLYKYGISLNKLFTYFASGKPIVFSGTTAKDLVVEAKAGFSVAPEQPVAIADAVLALKNDPQSSAAMGANGRHFVAKHYDTPILADKLEKLFQSHNIS